MKKKQAKVLQTARFYSRQKSDPVVGSVLCVTVIIHVVLIMKNTSAWS